MNSSFNFYKAYGMNIKSSIILPGIVSKFKKSDINIIFDELSRFPSENCIKSDYNNLKLQIADNIIGIFWNDIEICRIQNSDEIIINQLSGLKDRFLVLAILGTAIPLILNKRNMLMLHGTALNIDNNAIAFIGSEGAGKSTTSFAFIKKGYRLLSDDVLGIKLNNENIPNVISGFPVIKLWPEVIRNMGENPDLMPKIQSGVEKRFYYTYNNFINESVPLKMIFLIKETRKDTIIRDHSLQESTIELVKSTLYANSFNNTQLINNLINCGEIAKRVPIKLLEVKRSLNDIPNLVKIVESYITSK